MILRLVLYVDDVPLPIVLEDACVRVYNLLELTTHLRNVLQRPPLLVSYWNFEHGRYEPLTSLQNLQNHQGGDISASGVGVTAVVPVQLWVETRLPRLEPIDPNVDVEEYMQLWDHVRQWSGSECITYSLQSALRVSNPYTERMFDYVRSAQLGGHSDRVELLYYTNNSLSCREVVQRGFDRDTRSGSITPSPGDAPAAPTSSGNPHLPLFVFSSHLMDKNGRELVSMGPHKAFLCEVVPGRSWESGTPLSINHDAPPPPPGYDSVCHHATRDNGLVVRSIRVGSNHQALPRYLLTLIGNKNNPGSEGICHARLGTAFPVSPSPLDASRRAVTLGGSRIPLVRNVSFMQGNLQQKDSTLLPDGGRASAALLPSTITCTIHIGSLLGLWCVTCSRTICPYCASVGDHKGHEVEDVERVADEVRGKMQAVCHDLSVQLDSYKRVESQLQGEQAKLQQKYIEAVHMLETAFADLHTLIDSKKCTLLARMQEHTHCLDKPLDEVNCVVEHYKKSIALLEGSWSVAKGHTIPMADAKGHQPSAAAAAAAYLIEAPDLLKRGICLAANPQGGSVELAIDAAKQMRTNEATIFHVDCTAVRRSIEEVGCTRSGSGGVGETPPLAITGTVHPKNYYNRLSTSPCKMVRESLSPLGMESPTARPMALQCGGKLHKMPCDDLSGVALDPTGRQLFLQQLADLRRGYVWCLHEVNRYFHPEQRRAICSRSFQLLSLEWDLRIQTPDTLTGCSTSTQQPATPSAEGESVGIFLFPVGHTMRLDFRVIIFSAIVWTEWTVTGWAVSFAGKGWGVYPLLPRRELMQTDRLALDNTLKICVVPTSGLY